MLEESLLGGGANRACELLYPRDRPGGSIVVHVDQLKPGYMRESWETSDGASAGAAHQRTQLDSTLGVEGLTCP